MTRYAYIEDNCSDYVLLKTVIGRDVDRYKSVGEFLNRKQEYDVIFVDLNLPDAWGTDILDMIEGQVNSAVVIVITGTAGQYMRGKTKKALIDMGAYDVIQKDGICVLPSILKELNV